MAPKFCTFRTVFFVYSFINIVRYIYVGVIVAKTNYEKTARLNKYTYYCCDCYAVSRRREDYGLLEDKRFDLSYGIPKCTDCDECKKQLNNTANNVSSTCPVGNYTNKYTSPHFHLPSVDYWNDQTGCPDDISLTAMLFWIKSYDTYAHWSIGITVIYCVALLMCAGIVYFSKSRTNHVLLIMYVYNLVINEVYLYLFFKPFEFHTVSVIYNNKKIFCQVSIIDNKLQDGKGYIAFCSFLAIILHILYTLKTIGCCVKICIQRRRICRCTCCGLELCSNSVRYNISPSINLSDATNIHNYGTPSPGVLLFPHKHCSKYITCRNMLLLIMLVLLVIIFSAWLILAIRIAHVDDDKYTTHRPLVFSLVCISFVDNPWIWKCLWKWLWKKLKNCLCGRNNDNAPIEMM